jgi:hypothetical protein
MGLITDRHSTRYIDPDCSLCFDKQKNPFRVLGFVEVRSKTISIEGVEYPFPGDAIRRFTLHFEDDEAAAVDVFCSMDREQFDQICQGDNPFDCQCNF